MADIEKAISLPTCRRKHQDGYASVAAFVASDPDHESYVFRKFDRLTARKLLHMQSRILELEDCLADFDDEAAASLDPELHLSARSWEVLMVNADSRGDGSHWEQRRRLNDEVEERLDKYHRALLLQSEVAKLQKPPVRVITAYREALLGRDGKDPRLGGKAQHILDDEEDLAMLNPPANNDALTHFFRRHWIFKLRAPGYDSSIRYFDEQSLTYFINILSTVIAATLLTSSILALYFVTNNDARLGIVLAFIVLFAMGLSISTSASRDAIFAATAAYSAVLIVYISGNAGGASGGINGSTMCNCTGL